MTNLIQVVREAVHERYDVLGEMGEGDNGTVVLLARDLLSTRLVAITAKPAPGERPPVAFNVADRLDASIPSFASHCPNCHAVLKRWTRFCTKCGNDLSGIGTSGSTDALPEHELLAAVAQAAAEHYEVIGEMRRREGGGRVYFARERASGRIAALRLRRVPDENRAGETNYSLARTQVLRPLVEGLRADQPNEVLPAPAAEPPHNSRDERPRRSSPAGLPLPVQRRSVDDGRPARMSARVGVVIAVLALIGLGLVVVLR